MTERGDNGDTTELSSSSTESGGGGTPGVSSAEGAEALAEGASEAVVPAPADATTPAPSLDPSATTPDREDPAQAVAGAADERPELFVGGAFVAGLAVALLLRRAAGD